jgi:hypothetical protein
MPARGQITPGLPVQTLHHLKRAEALNERVDALLTVLEDREEYPALRLPRRQVNTVIRALEDIQEMVIEGIRRYHEDLEERSRGRDGGNP